MKPLVCHVVATPEGEWIAEPERVRHGSRAELRAGQPPLVVAHDLDHAARFTRERAELVARLTGGRALTLEDAWRIT